jgi:hypothetical protein
MKKSGSGARLDPPRFLNVAKHFAARKAADHGNG